jgi:hypothetical protein
MKFNQCNKSAILLLKIGIVIIFLLSSFDNLKSQSYDVDHCFQLYTPPGMQCDAQWTSSTKIIQIPLLPGCDFSVSFKYKMCSLLNTNCNPPIMQQSMQVMFIGFSISDQGCRYAYNQLAFPGYPNDFSSLNEGFFASTVDELMEAVSKELFEEFYLGDGQQANELRCNGVHPNCLQPDGCQGFDITYMYNKCHDVCFQPACPGHWEFDQWSSAPCASSVESCCEVKRQFCACVDSFGNFLQVHYNEIRTNYPGDCSDSPWSQEPFCPTTGTACERYYFPCQAACE